MACGESTAKIFMIFINVIFWLGGGALLGIGLWLLLDDSPLDFLDDMTIPNPKDDALWSVAIYIIVAVGAFVFILGFIGCCGACVNNQCLISMYIILVSVVLIAELVGAVLMVIFSQSIGDNLAKGMKKGLVERYSNETSTDGDSTAWNKMQVELKCCGVHDFKDYDTSKYKNATGNMVPWTCCVLEEDEDGDIDQDDVANIEACRVEAATRNNQTVFLHSEGCYKSMQGWLSTHSLIIMAIGFGFLAIQILGIIFACCLRSALSDSEKVY